MNFFSPAIMRRLFAPQHELSCSWFLWRRLKVKLRERGRHCSRESGAFLLGRRENGSAEVAHPDSLYHVRCGQNGNGKDYPLYQNRLH